MPASMCGRPQSHHTFISTTSASQPAAAATLAAAAGVTPTHLVEVLLWDATSLVTDAYREVAAA